MTYGVKVMYIYSVEDKNFYEESILMLQAKSFDEALDKAEAYAATRETEYINTKDKAVKLIKTEVVDSFLIYEGDEITEVYSSFGTNKTTLKDNEFYNAITDIADASELNPLRHK